MQKTAHSHYLGYINSLSMQSIDNVAHGMKDYIGICIEILKLIKFSLKIENMLEEIKMCEIIIAKSHYNLEKGNNINILL